MNEHGWLDAADYEKIRDSYQPSYHVVGIAQKMLEQEGIRVAQGTIRRYWGGLETMHMWDFLKGRVKQYSESCNNEPDATAQMMTREISKLIPEYSTTPASIIVQMRNLGITPKFKKRVKYPPSPKKNPHNSRKSTRKGFSRKYDLFEAPESHYFEIPKQKD